jgi:polyferredoxin
MKRINKYIKYLLLLAITLFSFVVQVKAQFDDPPPDFDPPPDNDVPLDTYQWIMILLAIAYGIYIYKKHQHKLKQASLHLSTK